MDHTLILTGDMNFTGETDAAVPFNRIDHVTQAADVVFGNLECCFHDRPDHDPSRREGFYAAPDVAVALKHAGFAAVGCANNVTFGDNAILDSLARLDELGIAHTGAGPDREAAYRPAIVERDGRRFGFVQRTSAYWPKNHEATEDTPGVAVLKGHTAYRPLQDELAPNRPGVPPEIVTWADPTQLQAYQEELAALSDQVDYLVASHHWGYKTDVLAYQTEIAHAAIDAGADAVLGHGPHFPLGIELYRGKPIFYGACNFSFNRGHREAHMEWVGYFATIRFDGAGPTEIDLRLVRRNEANETLLREPADEPETVSGLLAQSASFETRLAIEADRIVVWRRDG